MFVSRSLNYSRREFIPSYIGLRLLLQGFHDRDPGAILSSYIQRKTLSGRQHRYRTYQIYKGTTKNGEIEYRNCSSASPTSMLTEAYILERLAKDIVFSNKKYVYSYNWPNTKSAQCYDYFFKGYYRRNNDISLAMGNSHSKDKCVVLLDLRNFYPSIDRSKTLSLFRKALGHSGLSKIDKDIADFVSSEVLLGSGRGIPVGPPVSHALANFAFDDIDEKLWRTFPGKYFRYVDDIAVVVERSLADRTAQEIGNIVADSGYAINERKTHVVPAEEWFSSLDQSDPEPSFNTLREAITIYLALRPSGGSSLQAGLVTNGFNLPITHFLRTSTGYGWRAHLANALKLRWRSEATYIAIRGPDAISSYAAELRLVLEARARKLSGWTEPVDTFGGKTRLRRLSRVLHPMLYMYPPSELDHLSEFIPELPETQHLRTLLKACSNADATQLLSYPGKTVSTFAQLWSEAQLPPPRIDWPNQLAPAERDAAAILALAGVTRLPERFTAGGLDRVDAGFLAFCAEIAPSKREYDDFSYEDEIRTLQIGTEAGTGKQLLSSRFDRGEEVLFEGLYLGTGVSS